MSIAPASLDLDGLRQVQQDPRPPGKPLPRFIILRVIIEEKGGTTMSVCLLREEDRGEGGEGLFTILSL